MCNRIFFNILFFGVHSLCAPSCVGSSSSYMQNEIRESTIINLERNAFVAVSPTSSFERQVLERLSKLELETSELKEDIKELKGKAEDIKDKQCGMEGLQLAKPFRRDQIFCKSNGVNARIDLDKLDILAQDTDNLIRFDRTKRLYQKYLKRAINNKDLPLKVTYTYNINMLDERIEYMNGVMEKRIREYFGF